MSNDASLLSSAKDFLVEAIIKFNERKYQFAIVHAVTATELVLKERLARISPILIYKNIDSFQLEKEHTLNLNQIPQRLANFGLPLSQIEVSLIRTFAEWRNQIVHHMPGFDRKTAQRQLPQLLNTLALFLRRDLSTPLESFLPTRLYRVVHGLLEDWRSVVEAAKKSASEEGSVLPDSCPRCGASSVMCLRKDSEVYCHLCKGISHRYGRCSDCGRKIIISSPVVESSVYCDECIDAAVEIAIQMQADIMRGK